MWLGHQGVWSRDHRCMEQGPRATQGGREAQRGLSCAKQPCSTHPPHPPHPHTHTPSPPLRPHPLKVRAHEGAQLGKAHVRGQRQDAQLLVAPGLRQGAEGGKGRGWAAPGSKAGSRGAAKEKTGCTPGSRTPNAAGNEENWLRAGASRAGPAFAARGLHLPALPLTGRPAPSPAGSGSISSLGPASLPPAACFCLRSAMPLELRGGRWR